MNRLLSHPVRPGTRLVEVIRRTGVGDFEGGHWVAGGAARAVFMGQEVRRAGDIDVFQRDQSVANFVIQRIRERTSIQHTQNDSNDTKTFLTMVQLSEELTVKAKFQVVGHNWRFNTVEELFSTFDFTVCQFATDGYTIYYTEAAAEDARNSVLRIQPDRQHSRPSRLMKYLNMGFEPEGPLLGHALNLSTVDVNDAMVMRYEY